MKPVGYSIPCAACGSKVDIANLVLQKYCGFCGIINQCDKCHTMHPAPGHECDYFARLRKEAPP